MGKNIVYEGGLVGSLMTQCPEKRREVGVRRTCSKCPMFLRYIDTGGIGKGYVECSEQEKVSV